MRLTLEQTTEDFPEKKKIVIEVDNDMLNLSDMIDEFIVPALQGIGFTYIDREKLAEHLQEE